MKGGNGCVFKFLGSAKKWKAVMQRAKRAELRSSPERRTKRTKRAKQRDEAKNLSGSRTKSAEVFKPQRTQSAQRNNQRTPFVRVRLHSP